MDSLVKDVLDHIKERLDKIQTQQEIQQGRQVQLDSVIERLDTIQNYLEIQNQKQNLLDQRLATITSTLEQEKLFMRDQLQDAQREIMERLQNMCEQSHTNLTQYTSLQGETVMCHGDSKISTKALGSDDVTAKSQKEGIKPLENADKLEKVVVTNISTPPTSQTSTEPSAVKMVPKQGFETTTEDILDPINALTRAEPVSLERQVDHHLSEFFTVADKKLQNVSAEIARLAQEIEQTKSSLKDELRNTMQEMTVQLNTETSMAIQSSADSMAQRLKTSICDEVQEGIQNLTMVNALLADKFQMTGKTCTATLRRFDIVSMEMKVGILLVIGLMILGFAITYPHQCSVSSKCLLF